MKAAGQSTERLFTRDYILLLASTFAGFAGFQFLLPVLPPYILSLGGSESQVGLVNGLFAVTSVLARPFIGQEADRRGKKRLLMWGSLAIAVLMAAYNLAFSVALLFVVRLFHGPAWAATTTSGGALAADMAPASRRGEAMGYFGTSGSLAMAVAPLAAVAVLSAYGFNEVFLAASAAVIVALMIASLIREPTPATPAVASQGETGKSGLSAVAGLVYRPALLPALTTLTISMTYGAMITYVTLQALRYNVNPGIFFTVYAVCLIVSRPLGGRIADVAGRNACIIPGTVGVAAGMGLLALATDLPHFLAAGALYGAGFAFATPSLMALTIDRAAPEARGAAMGTYTSAFDLGIGLGATLLGFVLERAGFQVMYLAAAAIALASLGLHVRWSGRG